MLTFDDDTEYIDPAQDGPAKGNLSQGRLRMDGLDQGRLRMAGLDQGRLRMEELDQGRLRMAGLDQGRLRMEELDQGRLRMAGLDQGRLRMAGLDQGRLRMEELDQGRHRMEEPDKGHLSLSMLNGLVRQTIELTMADQYWVEAEIASVHESRGHCYMELIEKDEFNNTPIAQARACCWSRTWMRISPRFVRETGQELHAGMKVLLKVKANFHEAYGFSWIVNDIDPTYTMGDMALRKQKILQQLRDEGVIDLNKSLEIPMFAKRIAVISSATAAGYGDFCNQLIDNEYHFAFTTRLFPSIMQGEGVEQGIISALEKIYAEVDDFDVVVIIRGGGSTSDLSGFDTLALAENVANFPLPVITGIGHDRDQSVLDIVACQSVKTPTAAAAFLIDNLAATFEAIEDCKERIVRAVQTRMQSESLRLSRIEQYFASAFSIRKLKAESHIDDLLHRMVNSISQRLLSEQSNINIISQRIPILLTTRLEREKHRLEMLEQKAQAQNPVNILRRGYSIALHNGYAVRDPKQLKPGDEVSIVVEKGVVETVVSLPS